MRPQPIQKKRIRKIERPFGWIPFRLLSEGYLNELSPQGKLLYFVLCLVADKSGISFYGDARLIAILSLSRQELVDARDELCRQDLLAYENRVYQLLSLPTRDSLGALERKRKGKAAIVTSRTKSLVHIKDIIDNLQQSSAPDETDEIT